jgi:hypothetical protein
LQQVDPFAIENDCFQELSQSLGFGSCSLKDGRSGEKQDAPDSSLPIAGSFIIQSGLSECRRLLANCKIFVI